MNSDDEIREILNEDPDRRRKRQERDRLLERAAELTIELGEWDGWLQACLFAWDGASADNPELWVTWHMVCEQLTGYFNADPEALDDPRNFKD